MANDPPDVKPGPLPPERTGATGPGAYAKWRATTLGTVTETLEQRHILGLVGSVEGKRVLDLGCGDGLLTATLATHGARVATESFAGVGYPFAADVIRSGDTVLDIGSGSGTDTLIAAMQSPGSAPCGRMAHARSHR